MVEEKEEEEFREIRQSVFESMEPVEDEDDYMEDAVEYFHESYGGFVSKDNIERALREYWSISRKIRNLKSDIEQRTDAWYLLRYNMITASSVWKIFRSVAQRNSLIYEKCLPPPAALGSNQSGPNSGGGGPRQWGQKYEPLSALLYERRFNTRLGEFGCIQHPRHEFLGASPDGINVDPASPLYGTMVEIKNIVNRPITGTPKDEYWIQMQIQMEVCDLDRCHFVETRFKEYAGGRREFYEDEKHTVRGVATRALTPLAETTTEKYIFHILETNENMKYEEIIAWTKTLPNPLTHEYLYWFLDEMSCVMVERDRDWFQSHVAAMEETWATIVKERVEGYDHRKPKSRKQPSDMPHPGLFADDEDVVIAI
jgi:hypothetical protein